MRFVEFYSHVNYSVTKIVLVISKPADKFYSHVNYSVTKIDEDSYRYAPMFYSHVNYSVTKITSMADSIIESFTVT